MSQFGSSAAWRVARRVAVLLLFLELLYLGVFNYLLNSDSLRERIRTFASDLGSEQLEITWGRAWTLYPAVIHLDDLQLSGLAHGRRWEGSADSLVASISPWKLFSHSVKFSSLAVKNLDYRSKKEEITPEAQTPKEAPAAFSERTRKDPEEDRSQHPSGRKWEVELRHLKISGEHHIESSKVIGKVEGTVEADMDLSLRKHLGQVGMGRVELKTDLLNSPSGDPVVKSASIKGGFSVAPLDFRKERGRALVKFLSFEFDLAAYMQTLKVLDRQLHALRGIDISGSGNLKSHIAFAGGKFLPATKMELQAREMHLRRDPYEARGEGTLLLTAGSGDPAEMNLSIGFNQYHVSRLEPAGKSTRQITLFSGNGLELKTDLPATVEGLEKVYRQRGAEEEVALKITTARIGDLRIFSPYFSRQLPLELLGGSAAMNADLHWREKDLHGAIHLRSEDLHLRVGDRKFSALLKANIVIDHGDIDRRRFDIAGTTMTVEQVKAETPSVDRILTEAWNAGVTFDRGIVTLEKPLKLNALLQVAAKDSSPFLALVKSGKFSFSLISKFLLVRNLQGSASIEMEGNDVRIPLAKLKGGRLQIETKALFAPGTQTGAVLFTHSNIRAFAGIENGRVDLDIFNTKSRFDGYQLPPSPLPK